jgi:hypothetical protein
VWYGVGSVANAPGFICLRGLPANYPLPKKPEDFKIQQEYLNGMKSKKFREYCIEQGRAAMFHNFIYMAETMTVPSYGTISVKEFAKLPRHRQLSMSGYGVMEWIGDPTCVCYCVPFVRDRPLFQTEKAFWALPGQEGAEGDLPAPVPPPVVDRSIPMVCYANQKKPKRKAVTRKKPVSKPRRQRKPPVEESEESEKSDLSMAEEEDSEQEERNPEIPDDWASNHEDAKVGTFAVVETIYGNDDVEEKRGVALSQVLHYFALNFLLFFGFMAGS